MSDYVVISAYAIVALFAIYGMVELYLRILPCETAQDDGSEL